eukprot:CAMPEP_0179094402 /NCGR_PEP_ID=MMETSP0796-20121207/43292_1 /TAXON_ID=73915 /ORGANISM="Pyrodinium bahamense, Strain pbaha01" /LENGTH=366 /DNA_ID=CAMNT_0020792073 /DNA_START=55 /DNA_END=1151 /DNA_ORIENTATION=-
MKACGTGLANEMELAAQAAGLPDPVPHAAGATVREGRDAMDPAYPEIAEFATAGMRGGIPSGLAVVVSWAAGGDLQDGIDRAAKAGGGVLLLGEGEYIIDKTVTIPSGVVMRGAGRDKVTLRCTMRSTIKKAALRFHRAMKSGLEDLTVIYDAGGLEPMDKEKPNDGGWFGEAFRNNPHGAADLYVVLVAMDSASTDCWVRHCSILKSGTDPVLIAGNHNHFEANFVDRCFNKGGGGNGYFDLRGSYNWVEGCTFKRIRHFAVQQGAAYNVVTKNRIEVDVNFHNMDRGHNLIEGNEVMVPSWHGWGIFTTGEKGTHRAPGERNFIFRNRTKYKWHPENQKFADPAKIYTFTGYGEPVAMDWDLPA